MASERVPPATQATENAPQRDSHPEPALQSPEGDPFRSREGSPRQYTSQINPTSGNNPPPSTNPHTSSVEKFEDGDSITGIPDLNRNSAHPGHVSTFPTYPSPARYQGDVRPGIRRTRTTDTGRVSLPPHSVVDHIVPSIEMKQQQADIKARLAPTIKVAEEERDRYAWKAKWTGYALNAAIGLQVLLGSLTTGLSAAATTGRSAAVQTTILGGLSTIVASYLARSRGTNEPEQSNAKVKDLDHFIRECRAFELDHGHVVGDEEMDRILIGKRKQLELLLGNTSNGQTPAPASATSEPVKLSKPSPV